MGWHSKKINPDLKEKFSLANKYMDYISIAKGVHNYEFAKKIADKIRSIIDELDKNIK